MLGRLPPIKIFCALIVAAIAVHAPRAFACDAVISETPSTLRFEYDPFEPAKNIATSTFSIENMSDDPCPIDIAIVSTGTVPLDETEVATSGVHIRFQAGSGDLSLATSAPPGIWTASLEPRKRYRIAIDARIIRDAMAAAGVHRETLSLELRSRGSLAPLHAPSKLTAELVSKPRAQMNIAGTSGSFGQGPSISIVDFGELRSHDERRLFLQVRANTAARLTIESQNKGRLVAEKIPSDQGGIPYQAFLSDKEVDLLQISQIVLSIPPSLAGTSLPFDLKIGEVGAHPAGTYSDHLSINISPL
ncbi:hypothetical protein [Sphingopyxis yananensis]|uniref:hypothetical protein n=1 Tax=Sphingopyxis yananensis TaxID=2886687 RepID=UPI001D10AC7E|nr:hypothetical protein [Sphingopyxis yananensis]MCC2603632.1 hypothetical protein [Sphingopyxis yananensis]